MFCVHCGKNIDNAKVCPYCGIPAKKKEPEGGAPVSQAENNIKIAPVTPQPEAKRERKAAKQKSGKGLIVLLIILIVLLLGVIAGGTWFVIDYLNDEGKDGKQGGKQPDAVEVSVPEQDADEEDEPEDADEAEADEERDPVQRFVANPDRYVIVKDSCNWYDAKSYAEDYGKNAHLVTFNSIEEFEFVCSLAEEEGMRVFWAGVRVREHEEWETNPKDVCGDIFKKRYVNWLDGEPSGYDESLPVDEQIFEGALNVIHKDGEWGANDAPAMTEYNASNSGYIIEIEELKQVKK